MTNFGHRLAQRRRQLFLGGAILGAKKLGSFKIKHLGVLLDNLVVEADTIEIAYGYLG